MTVAAAPVGRGTIPRASASVVVCTYSGERTELLRRVVDEVRGQLRPDDELIVVVDHNPRLLDRLFETLKARVIPNDQPRGLSGARNTGVRAAGGDVVVFLDDDAVPCRGWLEELLSPLADEEVVGVGGEVRAKWLTARPTWFAPEYDWVVGCSYSGQRLGAVRNPIGANMAFRRSALVAVGGFHPGLGRVGKTPLGCEETDLGLRVQAAGLGTCVVVDGARVDHHVPAERATLAYLTRRCFAEGVSKAEVVRRSKVVVGGDRRSSARAMAPERLYLLALVRGMGRGITAAVRERRVGLLARSITIPVGLIVAVYGYARGVVSPARAGEAR